MASLRADSAILLSIDFVYISYDYCFSDYMN